MKDWPKPVLCSGEILFDFISREPMKGLEGTTLFEKKPGGAPFNISAGLHRLGVPMEFLAKIGMDEFGNALLEYLKSLGMSTGYIVRERGTKTPIAFAALDGEGKPEFRFYWDHAAHLSLKSEEIREIDPLNFSLFHFGAIVLLEEPSASTYMELFERFSSGGVKTSFDPNIRRSAIEEHDSFRAIVKEIISRVDILKLSDDDLLYICDSDSLDKALSRLEVRPDTLVFLTLGSRGSIVYRGRTSVRREGFKVRVAETTGCGDSFMAAVISRLYNMDHKELHNLTEEALGSILTFANAEAAIVATRYGGASSMPTESEVNQFLMERGVDR
ncbi:MULTISPECIES: carbohydrate kinase family protein [unclassified Mesotoga]|jgi:fructokinase|uniref:carbohydrate kinase family protein n=1 Tax=unclassified Mesotoga TaxID=1184398 RepID=UPI0025CDBEAE|nr:MULTISPECIES: carbohydrate kinase [unclassified Mesotoga]